MITVSLQYGLARKCTQTYSEGATIATVEQDQEARSYLKLPEKVEFFSNGVKLPAGTPLYDGLALTIADTPKEKGAI